MADFRSRAKPVNDFRSRAMAVPASFQVSEPALNEGAEYHDPSQGPDPETLLQGLGSGISLGYLPEAQAAVAAGLDPELEYDQALEQMRAREQALMAVNPGSYLAGVAGGSLLLPLPTPKGTPLVKAVKSALQGGATGFAVNPGETETPIEDRLKNAALGLGIGGTAQVGINTIERLSPALAKLRKNLALRTAGAMKSQVKEVMKKGTAPRIESFMQKEGMLRPGTSAEDVLERSSKIADDSGKQIGEIYDEVSNDLQTLKTSGRLNKKELELLHKNELNPTNLADEILSDASKSARGEAGGKAALKTLESELENLKSLQNVDATQPSDITELFNYRRSLDKNIKYNKTYAESPTNQKLLRDARDKIQERINNHIKAIDQVTKNENSKLLGQLNERFGSARSVEDIAENRVASDRAKSAIMNIGVGGGLGALYGSPGGAYGTAEGAALGTLGLMGARKFGPGLLYQAARAAQPLARGAARLPPRAITNPWLLMNEQE